MNSSGIKRGLAATAISALAITGVPLLSGTAYADSVDDQVGAGQVEIFTQYSGVASNQNDGVNTTIHLLAGGGSDVSQVQFSYTVGGAAAVNIGGPISRTNGAFSTEFAPPASTFGQSVVITATGLNTVGTPVAGAADTVTATINQNASAIDISNAPGSALGVFSQPYGQEAQEAGSPQAAIVHSTRQGIVTGTSSGTGAVELTDRSSANPATPRPAVTPAAPVNGVSAYRGTVDFAGYQLDTTAPIVNQAVVGAQQTGGSDDAEVVNLESQAIANVTAVANPATVNQGSTSTAVVSVLDAAGRPLAGAQVIKDVNRDGVWDYNGADDTINTADDEVSVYTNALGQASFAGLAGSAAGTTYDFFVNTSAGDDFEPNIDFRRSVTVTSQVQTTTALTATSADGAAFDTQEYAAGDISVQVNDQNGAGVPNGTTVSYTWTFTPAPTTATPNPTVETTTGTAQTTTPAGGNAGRANVGAPSNNFAGDGTYVLNAYIENNGTPGQQTGDLSAAPLTVKAGDSTLAFTEAPTATSISGTTDTYEASLRLFDGTALAGRLITFAYGPQGNSVVAAQANQPTGTTRTGDGGATATTNAQGTASVAVSDPATPDAAELGNTLNAQTSTNTIGNAAETAAPLEVNFVDGTPPANSTVTVDADTDQGDGKPGVASPGTALVTTDDTDPATPANPQSVGAGLAVTLTVSGNAFFTDGATVAGGTVGQPATIDNDGKTKTFVTDATGAIDFNTSIGRDTGFDDDGEVTVTVSATSGTGTGAVSGTDTETFSSNNPLNGGAVELVQSPASEQNNATDPTRVGDGVLYDVFTTDQFGNRVGGENVDIEFSGGGNNANSGINATSNFAADGDFFVGANEAGTVTLTATWNAPRDFAYTSATQAGQRARVDLTDTATEVFQEIDFANSTYTIASSPEGPVRVGSPVTESVTVLDQNGRPVSGLYVQFIRTGPGTQSGDANAVSQTNANGQAFYTFAGTQEGTAQISAVVTEDNPNDGGSGEPLATLTDSVVFTNGGTPPQPPVQSTATISGPNNGAKQDRINVSVRPAAAAAGAQVRLFKLVGNQPRQLGAAKRLSSAGKAVFNRRDQNGNGITRYFVRVVGNTKITGDQSNTRGLR